MPSTGESYCKIAWLGGGVLEVAARAYSKQAVADKQQASKQAAMLRVGALWTLRCVLHVDGRWRG